MKLWVAGSTVPRHFLMQYSKCAWEVFILSCHKASIITSTQMLGGLRGSTISSGAQTNLIGSHCPFFLNPQSYFETLFTCKLKNAFVSNLAGKGRNLELGHPVNAAYLPSQETAASVESVGQRQQICTSPLSRI
eukprot:1156443-Pelagomonas_calceolata.AAC.3